MNRSASRSEVAPERGRGSARRKTDVVLRTLRGEPLDALSRELGVTAATLAQENELLRERAERAEAGPPLASRRSRP